MLIDGDRFIGTQLTLTEPQKHIFPDKRWTPMNPVAYVEKLDGDLELDLSGTWAVKKWPFGKGGEKALTKAKVPVKKWDTVQQPGKVFYYDPHAQQEKIKNWNRVSLSHIDDEDGAVLRRTALIPKAFKGKQIYLRFDAVFPAGRFYLNGKLLGEHLSGLTPIEFDVTDRVTPGKEVSIAVRLLRKHKYVKMDMVRHAQEFCGMAQRAFFHATEKVQLMGKKLVTDLSKNLKTGEIKGAVDVRNLSKKTASATVELTLRELSGKKLAGNKVKAKVGAGEAVQLVPGVSIKNPRLWNDEFPNLYQVTVTLKVKGQKDQVVTYQTGFRRLDLSPKGARLNGNFIKFRGVNHLTFHPDHGMYTPKDWLRKSLSLMKKANVNCIRTHFLSPPELIDLCDEMGFYLFQELPVDWGTNYIHDPEWTGPAMMRLMGGVLRDRHRTSLMVWSTGNENMPEREAVADDGWNHLAIYDRFVKTLDGSRPTMFPPPGPANKIKGIFEVRVGDIADTHYCFSFVKDLLKTGKVINPRSWEGNTETCTRQEAVKRGWSGNWFSSEYVLFNLPPDLHEAPYLSIISDLKEDLLSRKSTFDTWRERMAYEWGFMRHEPSCLGGAYFPWICCGAGTDDPEGGNPWGWVRWGEDADWGVVTADLTPKPYFWGLRTFYSPVWFPKRLLWKKGETSIKFDIENQFNAIDLKDCTVRIQMGRGGRSMGMQRVYKDHNISCKPGQKKKATIPLWNKQTKEGLAEGQPVVVRIHLIKPDGFRVITHDIVVVPEKLQTEDGVLTIGPDAL